jgi:hypothetical protein
VVIWMLLALAQENAEPVAVEPDGQQAPSVEPEAEPVEEAPTLSEAEKVTVAEARRLTQEIVLHARSGRHEPVDRLYRQLVAMDGEVAAEVHGWAADAAFMLGDALLGVARLQRARDVARLTDVAARFGTVRLSVATAGLVVTGADAFAPDERAALTWLNARLAADGRCVAMLPAGAYEVGGRRFTVQAGSTSSLVLD